MAELYEIKSKAEYIADLITGILAGFKHEDIPQPLVDDIYRQMSDIADTIDEYHDFDCD